MLEAKKQELEEQRRGLEKGSTGAAVPTDAPESLGLGQMKFHIYIVNPIFAAVASVLPAFAIGVEQAATNTEVSRRQKPCPFRGSSRR